MWEDEEVETLSGRLVVFVPSNQNNVGVMDTSTETFSTVNIEGALGSAGEAPGWRAREGPRGTMCLHGVFHS